MRRWSLPLLLAVRLAAPDASPSPPPPPHPPTPAPRHRPTTNPRPPPAGPGRRSGPQPPQRNRSLARRPQPGRRPPRHTGPPGPHPGQAPQTCGSCAVQPTASPAPPSPPCATRSTADLGANQRGAKADGGSAETVGVNCPARMRSAAWCGQAGVCQVTDRNSPSALRVRTPPVVAVALQKPQKTTFNGNRSAEERDRVVSSNVCSCGGGTGARPHTYPPMLPAAAGLQGETVENPGTWRVRPPDHGKAPGQGVESSRGQSRHRKGGAVVHLTRRYG